MNDPLAYHSTERARSWSSQSFFSRTYTRVRIMCPLAIRRYSMQVCTAHGAGVCISCCSGYLHTCPAIQNYT